MGGLVGGCAKTDDPTELIAQARSYKNNGDTNAAIIQLKNALQKTPNNGEARFLLGEIYEQIGDLPAAEIETNKAQKAGVPQVRVAPLLGNISIARRQFQKALDDTAPANGLSETPELLVVRGNAYLGLNKLDDAKQAFQRSLEMKAGYDAAMVGLARQAALAGDLSRALALIDQAIVQNPASTTALNFKADIYRSTNRAEESLKIYERIIALDPKNIAAHIAMANVHIGSRQFDKAAVDLSAARKIQAKSLDILYSQALLDFNQEKNAAALESLQQLLRSAPDYLPAVLLAGAAQYGSGLYEQSEQNLRKYILAVPNDAYARKLLASLLLKTGQTEQANIFVSSALNDMPNDPQLLVMAGDASLKKNDFVKASEYFEKANVLTPQVAMIHTGLAISNMGRGDDEKGISELELASSLDVKSTKAGILLATTQLRKKQFAKALEATKSLEKRAPNDPEVQNLKGVVLLALNDVSSARAAFDKALSISPTYTAASENLARIDLQEGHPENARKRFESVLAVDKKNVPAMIALGMLAQSDGTPTAAASWFERAAAENPQAVAPALQLGSFYLKTGAKDKALTLARKLYAVNDNNAQVMDLLGQSQGASGDLAGALVTFQKMVAVQPNSSVPYMRLATVQLALKNEQDAKNSYQKALKLEPNNLEAQFILMRMAALAGDFDGATKIARQVQSQRQAQPVGFVMEGDLLFAQKKFNNAVKLYAQAASVSNNGVLVMKQHAALSAAGREKEADAHVLAWLNQHTADTQTRVFLGETYLSRKDGKSAVTQFEAALKAAPQNPVILNNLALAYQLEKDSRAQEIGERALKAAPTNPEIKDTLGWILIEKGADPRGLALLAEASAQQPSKEEIRLHLVTAMLKAGDKAGAKRELESLVLSKSPLVAAEAKRILKDI